MLSVLDGLKSYIIAGLLVLSLGAGVYGQYQHKQNVQLNIEVVTYKEAALANLKAKEDADASCKITTEALGGYYKNEIDASTSQKASGDAILALPTLTLKETHNALPTAIKKPSDDDRLSPELMQLLDSAYCYGDKDGCSQPTK